MHPTDLSIQDFTYTLPEDRIAKYPLTERDASRLLIYKDGNIAEDTYKNITAYLPSNSLLVFNNTKVVEARLLFQKPTGGVIEIFCLEPDEQYPDITTAMLQQGKVYWQCLVGGASKWKHGQVLAKEVNNGELTLHASYIEKKAGSFVIELSWTPSHLSFAEVLHYAGAIPLPPYIKRGVEELDKTRYQTIYAQLDGSVAAPTAGLHFTDTIFKQLDEKKIHTDFVTLHVGAGTFKPVKAATMKDHDMHAEYIDVSRKTIENLLKRLNDPIITVGTTSLRTIESLYWLGRQSAIVPIMPKASPTIGITTGNQPTVGQWEPYESNSSIPPKEALLSLLEQMDKNKTERLLAKTQIIIAPGYKPRIVKGVITNFHQPQSTLLLLVAALIGADWKKVYDHALQHGFRFLSYGDGCLLWTKE